MKIQLFVASLLLSECLLFGCAPRERVVENPLIEASNTMTLDIPRVELTDSATVLRMQAYFRPHTGSGSMGVATSRPGGANTG